MKILVYSDVHGNRQALEYLKKTDDFKTADMRIFLGDAISLGADTNYAVEFVQKYSDVCLLGNNDSYAVFGLSEEEKKKKPDIKLEHIKELSEELKPKNKKIIESWKKEYVLSAYGKTFRFLHFAWKTNTENQDIPETLDKQYYTKIFGTDYDYTFFGHFHPQFDFEYDGKKYYCDGSVGLKYPGKYLVLNISKDDVEVQRKGIEYDLKKFRRSIWNSKHKCGKDFVKTRLEDYLSRSEYEY